MTDEITTKKQILIVTPTERFEVGESIPLTVKYINRTQAPMTFRDPAKTWEVKLAVSDASDVKTEVPFGRKIYYKGENYERISIEDAEDVSLEPDESYAFDCDIGLRWPALFEPGRRTIRVVDYYDDAETVSSDNIFLLMVFSVESIDRLLNMAGNEESSVDARMFAARWIGEFYPEFRIAVENPTEDQEIENRQAIEAAREWWRTNRDTPETVAKIKEINKSAVRPPGGRS